MDHKYKYYDESVSEIVNNVPSWVIRRGLSFLLVIALSVIALSLFVKFPAAYPVLLKYTSNSKPAVVSYSLMPGVDSAGRYAADTVNNYVYLKDNFNELKTTQIVIPKTTELHLILSIKLKDSKDPFKYGSVFRIKSTGSNRQFSIQVQRKVKVDEGYIIFAKIAQADMKETLYQIMFTKDFQKATIIDYSNSLFSFFVGKMTL